LRILISGGAGFIASHLADRLLADGHEVIAVDNFLTGRRENIAHLAGTRQFEFIEHDVVEPFSVPGAVDYICHLASAASPVDYANHPIETLLVNSTGTKNLLDLAVKYDAPFLMASTSECYGDPEEHPQVETYWGNVNPIGPRSCYDEAKRFGEAIVMAYHRVHGVKTHIARIFNTYGPRMKLRDGRVVPAFLEQALNGNPMTVFGDGSQTRSFCYVSDLVDGLCRLMWSDERLPVNLGNPTEITILEFARRIQQLMGSSTEIDFQPLPEDDPRQRQPDISKARKLLGWEPKVALEDGLRDTIEYFRTQLVPLETEIS
jgi:dTDP-glucose 4,6-dehydratase